jgi:hypothetical protein
VPDHSEIIVNGVVGGQLWGVFNTCYDLKGSAGQSTGGGWLIRALRLLVRLSAYELDERSDRFGAADAFVYLGWLELGRIPVSNDDLRPRKSRPDPTQQELELGGGYGADRDEDHGIRGGVGLGLSGRGNSGEPTGRRTPGGDAEIETDRFGNQLRCSQIQAPSPGQDKDRPANRPRLGSDRRRLLLAPIFEGLLHELKVFSDRLAEFVDLLATEDAAFLIVRCDTERGNRDLVEIVLECMLADPMLGLLGGQARFFLQELMVKVLVRLEDRFVSKQYAQKIQAG